MKSLSSLQIAGTLRNIHKYRVALNSICGVNHWIITGLEICTNINQNQNTHICSAALRRRAKKVRSQEGKSPDHLIRSLNTVKCERKSKYFYSRNVGLEAAII